MVIFMYYLQRSFFERKVEQQRPNGTAKRYKMWIRLALNLVNNTRIKKYRNVQSGNAAFVDELVKWTFQEKSVLKVVSHYHHKANETEQQSAYRIKDDIVCCYLFFDVVFWFGILKNVCVCGC